MFARSYAAVLAVISLFHITCGRQFNTAVPDTSTNSFRGSFPKPSDISPPPLLENPIWRLQKYLPFSVVTEKAAGPPTLALEKVPIEMNSSIKGRLLRGFGGCNYYSAGVHWEKLTDQREEGDNSKGAYERGEFKIDSHVVTSLKSCPPHIQDMETQLFNLLPLAATYEISGRTLLLRDNRGQVLLEYIAQSPLSLYNLDWSLDYLFTPKNLKVKLIPGTTVTARFNNLSGSVSGKSGCNGYSGVASVVTHPPSVNHGQLSISSLRSTRMYCAEPEGVMEQEENFLAGLLRVDSYSIELSQGSRMGILSLADSSGATVVRMSKAMEQKQAPARPFII